MYEFFFCRTKNGTYTDCWKPSENTHGSEVIRDDEPVNAGLQLTQPHIEWIETKKDKMATLYGLGIFLILISLVAMFCFWTKCLKIL